MKKRIVALAAMFMVLVAGSTTGTILQATVTVTETSGAAQTNVVTAAPLSIAGLIDSGLLASDTQNIQLCDTGTTCLASGGTGDETPFSPGTTRTRLFTAQRYASSTDTYTDLTTAANDSNANDVGLLSTAPAINDAFYVVADHQFRVLWFDIGTAGARATTGWDLSWEYYNGSIYTGALNVTDNTNAFTATSSALTTVSWDIPTDMATTTVNGVTGYPVRARVTDAGTGTVTQPLATQLYYDIGLLRAFTESLPADTAINYDLRLGGASMTRSLKILSSATSSHLLIPGLAGYTVADHADLEPGIATSTKPWFIFGGHLDASETEKPRYLLRKGEDHYIRMSSTTAGTIEVHLSMSVDDCDFSIAGLESIEVSIRINFANGNPDYCGYDVAGANFSTADATGGTFVDNSDPWEFVRDGAFFWVGAFGVNLAGAIPTHSTAKYWGQVNGTIDAITIPDKFGSAHFATSSYPLVANTRSGAVGQFRPASTTAVLTNQQPSGIVVSVASTTDFAAATNIGSGLPGGAFLQGIATAGNVPVAFFWVALAAGIVCLTIMIVVTAVKNMLYAVIAGGIVMLMFATPQVGVFPIWGVFLYSVLGAVPVIIGRRLGLSA